jgi:hypothetical protein
MRRHNSRQGFGVDAKETEDANEPTDETSKREHPNPNRSTVQHILLFFLMAISKGGEVFARLTAAFFNRLFTCRKELKRQCRARNGL